MDAARNGQFSSDVKSGHAVHDYSMFADNFNSKWVPVNVTGGDYLSDGGKNNDAGCTAEVDSYLRELEANHYNSDHSLQPSYTAAIFWLFQNGVLQGVVKEHVDPTNAGKVSTLSFLASRKHVDLRITLPTNSAIPALVGSGIVIALSLAVFAFSKHQEQLVNEQIQVAEMAKAVLGVEPFFALSVKREMVPTDEFDDADTLDKSSTSSLGEMLLLEANQVPLNDLKLAAISFKRKSGKGDLITTQVQYPSPPCSQDDSVDRPLTVAPHPSCSHVCERHRHHSVELLCLHLCTMETLELFLSF